MFDGRFRSSFEVGFKPVGATLHKAGIRADHLTLAGVACAIGASLAIANGALRGGFLLLALAGLTDVLDGAVAKASGTASPRGAFFDSVADRFADALLFGGVAWYLQSTYGGHMFMLSLAVLAGAMLISYERAKAESLGYDARGGLMERAERFVFLGFGLLFDSLLVPVLWVMLALIVFTAAQRFAKVWAQASAERPVVARARPRTRSRRTARRTTRRTSDTWTTRVRTRRDR
jgi:CDP-diacylglycerol--glycerol-3-phosphate 3-phosphatidyltransferase